MRKSKTVLGNICKITMGQSPDSSTYNTTNIGLPFYQGNADFGELYPKTRIWCSEPQKIAEPENILLSVRAPIGALNIAKEKCCIGRGLAAITPHKNFCFNKYLFYILKYKYNELNARGTGSTFKAINKSILNNLPIDIYSIDRQKRIAAILDKATELIALRKQQIQKLDLLVKSRFIEMFGDPVVNSRKWKVISIVDCCSKITDGTHFSPKTFSTGKYKYITAKNIKIGGFDFSDITYVSNDTHKEIYSRCNPEHGDVLYIKDGATTGIAIVNTLHEEFTLLSSVALLKPNKALINAYYLCEVFNNKNMYIAIRKNMGGAAITRLTIKKINEIKLPLPPLPLQEEFATFVEQVDKSKSTLQQSLEKLELNYKALMQTYFG